MAWYASADNCVNRVNVPLTWKNRILEGWAAAGEAIGRQLVADLNRRGRPCVLALDGYKGAYFEQALTAVSAWLKANGIAVQTLNVHTMFLSQEAISKIVETYEKPSDPSFGRVYPGSLDDLIDHEKVQQRMAEWERDSTTSNRREVLICYGVGAALPRLRHLLTRIAYCDTTREQILIRADRNELLPVGADTPAGFPWKRIYYVEFPLLNRHKQHLLRSFDWYLDTSTATAPIALPDDIYHAMLADLSGRPICNKVFYMPGTFGGTEFRKRFKVEGLSNTSWDYELSVGDSHLLIDLGVNRPLETPFYNLIWEQPLRVLGNYSSTTYPDHFPLALYMQDGYFAEGDMSDFKRTHMPNHIHPDTAYCREHFGEPLGRYETYYIVRADLGARTMHGFTDDADIDEYVKCVRESELTGKEFDWRKFVYEHPSKTGELHQLPPGTVHGTGGRQIILEIDTNPSRESTEYSFYLYDYCRSTYNYKKHDFSGKPAKLQVEHSLAVMRRNRKQQFMAEHMRPAPLCIREGYDWREMSFPMFYNMPYQINRFEFVSTIADDTADLFHCLSLTRGTKARVYSQREPSNEFLLEDCDTIVLPACFGAYICENLGGGPCEIVKTFLITPKLCTES